MNIKNDLETCLLILQKGGIILYPTDTIWGIGCDATNKKAIQKIFKLKNREEKKSMIILVNNELMIRNYVMNASERLMKIMSDAERPTTGIFKNGHNLPANLINEDGSIAMRIARDEFCQELIELTGKPLVSTSANISGEKSPQNFSEVPEKIKNGVDYIVQHRQNDFSKKEPSSIIRLSESGEIEILR